MSTTTTPRKPRAAKATAPAVKPTPEAKPAPRDDVTLNLDTLEREDRKDAFTFLHLDRVYAINDPQDIDWQDQIRGFGDPIYFLQHAMSEADVKAFFDSKMPSWKLNKIMKAYQSHFGMPELGE